MKRIQSSIFAAAVCALALASPSARAHGGEAEKAPHGGQLREAGIFHFELVVAKDGTEAKESPVVVFVTDRVGAKLSTVGASATATILAGKTKVSANLVPDGENRMKGAAKYASTPDMKVVLSVTLAGKAAEQARFTPLAAAKVAQPEHKH